MIFGIGVAKSVDTVLGGLLSVVGICNVFTATVCRLASSISDATLDADGHQTQISDGDFGSLPIESQCHVVLVGVAVSLMLTGLVRDILYTRSGTPWARITAVLAALVLFGAVASPVWPAYIGLWERLSVYSIQLWQALIAIDRIHHHLTTSTAPSEYKRVPD